MRFVTRIIRKLHVESTLKLLGEFLRCLRRCQVGSSVVVQSVLQKQKSRTGLNEEDEEEEEVKGAP